jgi:peptidoglycan/xylan/chitin deacetylase (PgdA/CDA1 family)
MYHAISNENERSVSDYYRVVTPPETFRRHMAWLHENGYKTLSLHDALIRLTTDTFDESYVVVTFDDAFRECATVAYPILSTYGFTATVFVPTAFIGTTCSRFKGRACLTWSEIKSLRSAGLTFGSHTVSHRRLYDLTWTEVRNELVDSRATLEDQLGEQVEIIAYPYAFPQEDRQFVSRFIAEAKTAGYAANVTTIIGRAVCGSDPFLLRRLPINGADDTALFRAKLMGAYDWASVPQFIARKVKNSRERT